MKPWGTQFAAMNKNNCLIMKTIQIVSICVDINIAHGWYAKIQSCDWSNDFTNTNLLLAPLEAAYLRQLRPIMAPIGATKYFTKFFCRRLIKFLLWQFPHHWSSLRCLNSLSSLIFFLKWLLHTKKDGFNLLFQLRFLVFMVPFRMWSERRAKN